MKKTIVAIVLCGLLLPAAIVAESRHPGRHLDRLSEHLELSEEQKAQVGTIFEEQHEKHKALREEGKERINAVLTPEQQEKYTAHREKHKGYRRHHCSGSKDKDTGPGQGSDPE